MILPTYENLAAFRNHHIRIDPALYAGHFNPVSLLRHDVGTARLTADLVNDPTVPGGLYLKAADAATVNPGMYVTYVPGHASYGDANAAENWCCTGPFSGCRIEAGHRAGRKYLAHVAVEKGTDSRGAWVDEHVAGGVMHGADVQLRGKVDPGEGDTDAFVFVVWEGDQLSATKLGRRIVADGYVIDRVQKIVNSIK